MILQNHPKHRWPHSKIKQAYKDNRRFGVMIRDTHYATYPALTTYLYIAFDVNDATSRVVSRSGHQAIREYLIGAYYHTEEVYQEGETPNLDGWGFIVGHEKVGFFYNNIVITEWCAHRLIMGYVVPAPFTGTSYILRRK